jgi:hypothetical protein
MLSLKIGSLLVDTSDVDIPVVLRSPVFANDEGRIPASFIFNFSIPLTDQLKRELEFAHRAARKGTPTWKHPALLRFGLLKYSGTATITMIDEDEVEFSMPVDTGNFANDLGDLELKDLQIDDVLPWDPQIMYADVAEQFSFKHSQQLAFTEDILIEADFSPIDTFNGWNGTEYSFVAPAAGDYRILFHINSVFQFILNTPSLGPAGKDRKLLITKNGSALILQDIAGDSFTADEVLTLAEGDELKFYLRVSSKYSNLANYIDIDILPGTCISIDDNTSPFADIPTATYPDKNFAVFPYQNTLAMDNIPDSLFQVDINDIKENLARFAPVVNYYKDGSFPYVVSGLVNGLHISLLNMFSPAIYVAFIIKHIFSHIGYSIQNNLFETDELKRITALTPGYINNYFPGSGTIYLKDFMPEDTLKNFFRETCRMLGIVFKIDSITRIVELSFIDDIMADTSSIEFSNDVIDKPKLIPEQFNGFKLKTTPTECKYISDNYRSLEDVNIKGSVNTYAWLPAEDNELFDCYYVDIWHAWFIWNYDPDAGQYAWVFHSIDYNDEIKETDPDHGDPLEIDLKLSAPAMRVWDKDQPIQDPTIGSGTRLWHIPAFEHAGNFRNLPASYRKKSQYALIPYWGLQKDNGNYDYPFASNDVYRYSGDKIDIANLSLLPAGDYGLYEKKWKRFIQWRLDSPGEYKVMKKLTPVEISGLNWFKWHKIHGVDYLIKELRFNIKNDRISPGQLILYRR